MMTSQRHNDQSEDMIINQKTLWPIRKHEDQSYDTMTNPKTWHDVQSEDLMTNQKTLWPFRRHYDQSDDTLINQTIRGDIDQSKDKLTTKWHDDQYLKGISKTSSEISFMSGYIFLYILDDIINATETNKMEQKIHIHTNWEKNLQICI